MTSNARREVVDKMINGGHDEADLMLIELIKRNKALQKELDESYRENARLRR